MTTSLRSAAIRDAAALGAWAAEEGALARSKPRAMGAVAALAAAAMGADLSLSPGFAGGVVHVLLPMLGLWLARPAHALWLAGLASGLVAAGHVLTFGPVLVPILLVDRGLALLAVWTAAAVVSAAKRRERALRAHLEDAGAERAAQAAQAAALRARAEEAAGASLPAGYLSHVSHEMRTPLNAIIGFSEIARQEMFGPLGHERYREYADHIHRSGHRLLWVFERHLRLIGQGPGGPSGEAEPGARRPGGLEEPHHHGGGAPDDSRAAS